jgi:GrpB-like predicted nucleotidyltransferase (UPF0157 family)
MMSGNKRTIQVVDYNPKWLDMFRHETKIISEVLGREIVKAHHVGSTVIPFIKAKPIIDIMLEVKDVNMLDKYDTQMVKTGYTPKGEYGISERRFYIKGLYHRTHHIHAFNVESFGAKRHIAFRDYLIANPDIADEYSKLKVKCAIECNNDIDRYCKGKDAFIKFHEKKALDMIK